MKTHAVLLERSPFLPTGIIKHNLGSLSAGEERHIYFLGDMHFGRAGLQKHKLKKAIQIIANDPIGYWIDMGDSIDAISVSDFRHDSHSIDSELITDPANLDRIFQAQAEMYLEYIKPIKNKLLAKISGNHEDSVRRKQHIDIYELMLQGLFDHNQAEVKRHYLGYCGFIGLQFHRTGSNSGARTLSLYIHHGYGGGMYIGSNINKMERKLSEMSRVDVIAIGHIHQTGLGYKSKIEPNYYNMSIEQKEIAMLLTSTWIWGGSMAWETRRGYGVPINRVPMVIVKPYPTARDKMEIKVII